MAKSLYMSGTNSGLVLNDAETPVLDMGDGSGARNLMGWFVFNRLYTNTTKQTLFHNSGVGGYGILLEQTGDSGKAVLKATITSEGGTVSFYTSDFGMVVGEPYHIAVHVVNGVSTIKVNGWELGRETTTVGDMSLQGTPWCVGKNSAGTNLFQGWFTGFAFYGSTAYDLTTIVNNGAGKLYADSDVQYASADVPAITAFNFNEGVGTEIAAVGGAACTATLAAGTTWSTVWGVPFTVEETLYGTPFAIKQRRIRLFGSLGEAAENVLVPARAGVAVELISIHCTINQAETFEALLRSGASFEPFIFVSGNAIGNWQMDAIDPTAPLMAGEVGGGLKIVMPYGANLGGEAFIKYREVATSFTGNEEIPSNLWRIKQKVVAVMPAGTTPQELLPAVAGMQIQVYAIMVSGWIAFANPLVFETGVLPIRRFQLTTGDSDRFISLTMHQKSLTDPLFAGNVGQNIGALFGDDINTAGALKVYMQYKYVPAA